VCVCRGGGGGQIGWNCCQTFFFFLWHRLLTFFLVKYTRGKIQLKSSTLLFLLCVCVDHWEGRSRAGCCSHANLLQVSTGAPNNWWLGGLSYLFFFFFFFFSYMYYACMNVYVCICIYTLYSLQSKIRNKYVKFFFLFSLLAVVVRGDGVYIINRYIRSRVYWLQRRHIL
jgi:hypothetical protein